MQGPGLLVLFRHWCLFVHVLSSRQQMIPLCHDMGIPQPVNCLQKKTPVGAGSTIPEVDSVLTTAEVQQLIEQRGINLTQLPTSPVDPLLTSSRGNSNSTGSSTGNNNSMGSSTDNSHSSSNRNGNSSHGGRGRDVNNSSSDCSSSSQCDEGQLYGVRGGAGVATSVMCCMGCVGGQVWPLLSCAVWGAWGCRSAHFCHVL